MSKKIGFGLLGTSERVWTKYDINALKYHEMTEEEKKFFFDYFVEHLSNPDVIEDIVMDIFDEDISKKEADKTCCGLMRLLTTGATVAFKKKFGLPPAIAYRFENYKNLKKEL